MIALTTAAAVKITTAVAVKTHLSKGKAVTADMVLLLKAQWQPHLTQALDTVAAMAVMATPPIQISPETLAPTDL